MTTNGNSFNNFLLKTIQQQGGAISFAHFMELALYNPQYGYYTSRKDQLGKHGDFITAPEMTPLFAQCFAAPCQQILAALGEGDILELGAGTGRFACELLLALEKSDALPRQYFILDISPSLREQQRQHLEATCPHLIHRVCWLDKLPTNFVGVMIGNEVLDALPIHRFRIDHDAIKEYCVVINKDQFTFETRSPLSRGLAQMGEILRTRYALPHDYESEIHLALPDFIKSVTQSLKRGVMIFVDYGYGEPEYYRHDRNRGTLKCFHQHQQHENPLQIPGQQDITAHVNFTLVAESACEQDCTLLGYTSQAAFLLENQLIPLATAHEMYLSEIDKFNLHQAIKTLTMPTEMGERVKVIAFAKAIELTLSGFNLSDRRREL